MSRFLEALFVFGCSAVGWMMQYTGWLSLLVSRLPFERYPGFGRELPDFIMKHVL